MQTILVTGASGLLGANLVARARERGLEVVAAARRHRVKGPGIRFLVWPLEDMDAHGKLMEECRPQWVVHCAAWTDVDGCESQPEAALRLNSMASGALAAAADRIGAAFVYVSTDSVFDGATGAYAEEADPHPVNAYAHSKLEGERSVRAAHPGALVVRTNIFGWNARKKQSLAEWVLGKLRAGETVPGFRDVWFNPLHAADLAGILLDLLARDARGLVHAGSADTLSKYEFARAAAEVFGLNAELVAPATLAGSPLRARRPLNTGLDVRRLSSWLGRPLPTIREGLGAMREMETNGGLARLHELIEGD